MKKKFKLEDLDCANCAAKMEDAIKKIPGVNDASVSFMTQKMSIDAEDAKFDEIMKEVVAVCAKVETGLQNLILMNQWLLRDAAAISIPRRVICACGIKSAGYRKAW